MTAYLMTAEQHAQIVDALEWPTPGVAAQTQRNLALAMLKAMKPVEPLKICKGEVCYISTENDQSYGMWCPADLSNGTELYALGDTA